MSEFSFNIEAQPDYAALSVVVPKGKTLKVEASAMASMDLSLKMKTRLKGGFKRFLAKESFFLNEYTADGVDSEIVIAPGPPGDIGHYYVDGGKELFLTSTSYLASDTGVQIDSKFQGLAKGFFSGEGLFIMKCSGKGNVWFNTYGALFDVDVKGEYVVDTGHIVGFTEGLDYSVSRIGGYKSLFFSGEGFVARFKGEGKVWIQTKQPFALVNWADQFRIVKRSNNDYS